MFVEAARGTRRGGRTKTPCAFCNGSGVVPVDYKDRRKGQKTCPNCGGRGEI